MFLGNAIMDKGKADIAAKAAVLLIKCLLFIFDLV
jgi:hypothetical protein